MSKIAVLVTDMFEDSEYQEPVEAYRNAGHEIVNIDMEKKRVVGKHGLEVDIDETFEAARPEDFDVMFIPGGFSPDQLRADEAPVNFVKEFYETGKPIFMICHGAQLLISADLLKGRAVTGWRSIIKDIENAGGNFVDEEVVIDNNMISSRSPDDLPAFIESTLDVLEGLKMVEA